MKPLFSLAATASIMLGCCAVANAAATEPYTRNVAIVIWDGAEILDWTGPSEVFQAAAQFGRSGDARAFNVYTVSKTTDPVVSQQFIKVVPQYSIADAPRPDIIVLPGGGVGSVRDDAEFLAWAGRVAREAEVALSVCTGAFILGDAGLLNGKDATTWYGALDGLESTFPDARVHRGSRFVDNGQVITTAGVSAGIDGALHLVARLLGRYVADQTARYMEYKWSPESYLAQNYSLLNPSTDEQGRKLQQAGIARAAGDDDDAIAIYKALLKTDPDDAVVRIELASTYYNAKRWKEAGDAYVKSAAMESLRRNAFYNAACSYALAGDQNRAFDCLRDAANSGFADAQRLEADEDFKTLRDDPRFKRLVERVRAGESNRAEG